MAAEEQSHPHPLIEFHAIGHHRFPPPYPASRNIPEWYKQLDAKFTTGGAQSQVLPTIKRCPPFLDAKLPPSTQYLMPRGTPLMQAIPFQREQWQSQVGEDEKELREKTRQALQGNLHVYKEQNWRKKSFG